MLIASSLPLSPWTFHPIYFKSSLEHDNAYLPITNIKFNSVKISCLIFILSILSLLSLLLHHKFFVHLRRRNSKRMSEAQRSALNALLFRTGDQSRDMVLVLATNRPGDLDAAITDRIDEVIEFPLPGEEERFKLLNLYLNKYISSSQDDNDDKKPSFLKSLLSREHQKIVVKDVSDDVIREAAKKTEGFSGREIAKLMASVQAAVYGSPDCVLDAQLFMEIVDYKVSEHHQRLKLLGESKSSK